MSPRPLFTLAFLFAVVLLLISKEIIIASGMALGKTLTDHEAKTASETKEVDDEKYNGYGGYPGGGYGGYPGRGGGGYNGGYPGNGGGGYNGGYPGYPGNGGGGYNGGYPGYPGNGRGGYNGGYPGRGGGGRRGCYYGCCDRGYYRCRRCCSYAGEAVQTEVEAKPQN